MDLAQLGIKVDSATAVKATGDLDKLTAAGGRADVAVAGVGKASVRAAGGMSLAARQSQWVAGQLSQVAQQSMGAATFMQALSGHLPIMAFGLSAVGGAVGVLAGVALPLLASAFGGTSSKAKEAATAVDGLDGTTKAYFAAAKAAAAPTSELALQYGNLAVQARAALQAMSDVALVDAMTSVDAAIASVSDSVTKVAMFTGFRVLRDDFGLTADAANTLVSRIMLLERADGLQAQAVAAQRVSDALIQAYGSAEKMPAPLRAVFGQMSQITIKAAQVNAEVAKMPGILGLAASAAASVASAVSGIGTAAQGAIAGLSGLVGKMWELAYANRAASQARESASKTYGGRGADPRDFMNGPGNAQNNTFGGATYTPKAGGAGGGGGGAGTDDFAARIAQLQTEHETETAQANAWYAEAQATLADRRAIEVLGVQGHKDKLLQIEQIHQQQIAAIQTTAAAARLNDTASLFGSLASLAEIGGKKSAKAAATLAAVQTTVSGYATAMSAAALAPTLVGKIAAYAGWIATSAKAVAAIRSAGGVSGGGGGGRAPAAQAIAPQAQESRLVVQGIKLTDILTGQMLMDILQKEFGARNVAFLR